MDNDNGWRVFNLNDKIKVKLKPDGLKHFMNHWNRPLPGSKVQPLSFFKEKEDENGYIEFQAWEFIQIFGETIVFGSAPLFEINILLPSPPKTSDK